MATPSQIPSGGPPGRESSGRVRNLYLIEIVLGIGLLAMIVMIFYANNRQPGGAEVGIVTLTTENWQKEVVDSRVPVLVDFWAPWCPPCRQLSPTIDKLAGQYAGKIKVGKLNIDDAPEIAARYGINSIPRVFIFKGGAQPRRTLTGLTSEATLVDAIDSVLQ
jgi:thioredoxin 1